MATLAFLGGCWLVYRGLDAAGRAAALTLDNLLWRFNLPEDVVVVAAIAVTLLGSYLPSRLLLFLLRWRPVYAYEPVLDSLPSCCKCGYDLTGNLSGVCPECGQVLSQAAAKSRDFVIRPVKAVIALSLVAVVTAIGVVSLTPPPRDRPFPPLFCRDHSASCEVVFDVRSGALLIDRARNTLFLLPSFGDDRRSGIAVNPSLKQADLGVAGVKWCVPAEDNRLFIGGPQGDVKAYRLGRGFVNRLVGDDGAGGSNIYAAKPPDLIDVLIKSCRWRDSEAKNALSALR